MRTTTMSLFTIALLTITATTPARAQSAAPRPATTSYVMSVQVPSIVRMVTRAGDPSTGGAPTVQVVSNDPRFRQLTTAALRPDTTGPEQVTYAPIGRSQGGASALQGEAVAGPTTVRYTLALP